MPYWLFGLPIMLHYLSDYSNDVATTCFVGVLSQALVHRVLLRAISICSAPRYHEYIKHWSLNLSILVVLQC
jgi:hypothetical protein